MKKAILLLAGGLVAIFFLQTNTQSGTESTMLGWAQALNAHLATGGQTGDYSFPYELNEIAPELRANLSHQDTWATSSSTGAFVTTATS